MNAWLRRHGKWLIILPPMLYLLVFFLVPFGFALILVHHILKAAVALRG